MAIKINYDVLRLAQKNLLSAKAIISDSKSVQDYGTASSGNWGHKGRPGKVGGSGKGTGGFIGYLDDNAKGSAKDNHSIGSHLDKNGRVKTKRRNLHADIIKSFMDDVGKVDKPIIYFNGGGSASGKTSIAKAGLFGDIPVLGEKNGVVIDPDEIKKLIPEYNEMLAGERAADAAGFAHEESSALAKMVERQAIKAGDMDVLVDGTLGGNPNKIKTKILNAKKSGNPVVGNFATVDIDEALRRNYVRYLRSGRMPKIEIVITNHIGVSKNFEELGPLFDDCVLVDNNGAKPRKIAHYENNKLVVDDEIAYKKFKDKIGMDASTILKNFESERVKLYNKFYKENPGLEKYPM